MDTNDTELPDPDALDDDVRGASKQKPPRTAILAAAAALTVLVGGGWYVASGGLSSPEERCNASRLEAREAWLAYAEASRDFQDAAGPAVRESLAAHYRDHPAPSSRTRMRDESAARGLTRGPGPGPEAAQRLAENALRAHATDAWEEVERVRPVESDLGDGDGAEEPVGDVEETPEWLEPEDDGAAAPRWPSLDDSVVRAALADAVEHSEAAYEACRLVDP